VTGATLRTWLVFVADVPIAEVQAADLESARAIAARDLGILGIDPSRFRVASFALRGLKPKERKTP
jgi:hypothetical protein